MNKFFKLNMLITSFIPLWIVIVYIAIWDLWNKYKYFMEISLCSCNDMHEPVTPLIHMINVLLMACRENTIQLVFSGIILIVSIVATISILLFAQRKSSPDEKSGSVKIITARKSTTLVTDFLLLYILPMAAFNFSSIRDIFLFLIYFSFITFLSIRNGNVYTNVLFEIMKYRFYKCDIKRKVPAGQHLYYDCVIISKSNLTGKAGEEIPCFSFENTIYLDVNKP